MKPRYGVTRMRPRRFEGLPGVQEAQARHGLKKLTAKQQREQDNWQNYGADNTEGLVYFIQAGCNGPIKIGYSSWLTKRLGEMQVGNVEILLVRAAVPVNVSNLRKVEKALHERFEKAHLRGEWFRPVAELEWLIKQLGVSSLSETTLYLRSEDPSAATEEAE